MLFGTFLSLAACSAGVGQHDAVKSVSRPRMIKRFMGNPSIGLFPEEQVRSRSVCVK